MNDLGYVHYYSIDGKKDAKDEKDYLLETLIEVRVWIGSKEVVGKI